MTGRSFQRTSNERTKTMLKEATAFSDHLKQCQRAIIRMKDANEDLLSTAKAAMNAPLPHIYDETATAAGSAGRPMGSIGGPGYRPDVLTPLTQTFTTQVESQVLLPLSRWLDILVTLQGRGKEVEALRLEVDSRRRTVADLSSSVDATRAKMSKAGGQEAKLEANLDEIVRKLAHKEGKLALVSQTFEQQEGQLYDDLCTLIKDAQWLAHYVASTFRLGGEALMTAASAFDVNNRPSVSGSAAPSPAAVTPRTPGSVTASPSSGRATAVSDGRLSPNSPDNEANPFAVARPAAAVH